MMAAATGPEGDRGLARRIATLVVVALLALASWWTGLDAAADERVDAMLTRALVTFATARALDGVISVLQSGQVGAQVGVGMSIQPGELLDPVNDLVEQFSDVMLAVTVALGVHKVLLSIDGAMKWGWDEVYGGIKYFVDVLGHPPVQYEHDMKLWWPVSEALIASLKHYLETGGQRYWNDFERLTDYMETYLADLDYGEWFGYLRRDNKPTEPPAKGGIYKGPFHVPRALMAIDLMLQTLAQKL